MEEIVRIPVDVTNVSIGMYVVMLDRPWLETPFVFQGFEVRDRGEIDQLQAHCNYVYVDVVRSRLTASQVVALRGTGRRSNFPLHAAHESANTVPSLWRRIALRVGLHKYFATRFKSSQANGYRPSATVRAEAPAARRAYEAGVEALRLVRQSARDEETLEVEAIRAIVKPLQESILRNPDAMAWTVFSKKRSSRHYSRSLATAVWCIMFGRHLGFDASALADLGAGGLLLDIGNERLDESVTDEPGSISDEQYQRAREHVAAGLDILQRSDGFSERVLDMVRCHHERNDGSGYPEGLCGNRIPTFGRIAGIADCYDAMTSKTPYSPARAAYDAARELHGMRGTAFQAEVVEQFLRTVGMFPTGSVVELSNGRVGVVLEQNRLNPLRPKVMLLLDENGEPFASPVVRNLTDRFAEDGPSGPAWIEKGHEHGAFGIDPRALFA